MLPGGKVEQESHVTGALREIGQEAGQQLLNVLGGISLVAILHVNRRCPDTNIPFGPIAVYHAFASRAAPLLGPTDEFEPRWAPLGGPMLSDMLPDYSIWLPATYGFSQAGGGMNHYLEFDLRNIAAWNMNLRGAQDAPQECLVAA